ncbi:MAG: ketoacyl-ACP synthase III [Bacteroidales bacterium]|nr:ketoacyl-ACP synthase III [Bacteroidales bacterium]
MKKKNIVITGTGCYIPTEVVTNEDFARNIFYDMAGEAYDMPHQEIAEKFLAITGIVERRYVSDDLVASDIATLAAQEAIKDAGISAEDIDYIIVAHDYGDIRKNTIQTDTVPSLAARVKHGLGIRKNSCVANDILFGCPGWVQGIIQAESFIRTGIARRCLVIGTETLSRVMDLHDRDSMIYADGAGACILESTEEEFNRGILSHTAGSYTFEEAYYLFLGKSNIDNSDPKVRYIKMYGKKIYEFSLKYVPYAIQESLEKAGVEVMDVKKIFLHQANEKMDFEIIKRLYRLYHIRNIPEGVLPMSIHWLGNSSVATVPTLLDLVRKGKMPGHELKTGDLIVFASVGAGMNINSVAYRV